MMPAAPIVGAFLSTLFGPSGPALAQFPAPSHTWWLLVSALAVSVPAGTLVTREKLASAGTARPESLSVAAQAIPTSAACQSVSGAPQETAGGVVSGGSRVSEMIGCSSFHSW